MKSYGFHLASHKQLHTWSADSRSPPFDHSLAGTGSNHGIRVILGHSRVLVFGEVISHDVSCSCIVIFKFSVVVQDQEEVVRQIL